MRKKSLAIIAAIAVSLSLILGGCTKPTGGEKESTKSEQTQSGEVEQTSEVTETSSSQETSQVDTTTPKPKEPFVCDRSAAFELLSNITIGWNLGNTLDAHGAGPTIASEMFWGNPKTSQAMIDAVAAQGFNAIRIPVTFAEHVSKAPDYTVNEMWMDRVQEVVDYAMNAGMYVFLDTHHEPDYWLVPNRDHEEVALAELKAIWKQVAERFRDYDEHLVFEGMNEPRVKGSANEWNGGDPSERKIVDKLNQAFIDTVRETSGNNETRLLVICTYGHNAGYTAAKELAIPEDNYIAVAVHMYTPYYFTFAGDGGQFYDTWDGSKKSDISATLKQLNNYLLKKDVPVVVTEFGAVNKGKPEEVIKWAKDYLSIMNNYGIKCFWWDNNCYQTNGENFGIFDRRNLTWYDQKLADTLVEAAKGE